MMRRAWFALAFAAASAACAARDAGPAFIAPAPIRVPHAGFDRGARALDLQGGVDEDPDYEIALGEAATSTLAEGAQLSPNESIDLEMEAERADEAAALDEMERAPKKIVSILAVTGTVTYDIPVSEDAKVEQWVSYLMGRGRQWYEIWLSRSTRYVPIFQPILEQYGLPKDLIFLAMIESGFSPNAYSWAHAAGPWQFMPYTGKRFGLEVGFWVDERRDFVASTHAAAKYLKLLYKDFGHWHLAWAAYNAGEGRIGTAIRRSGAKDFWQLAKTRHIRRETRHYVPKLIAAAIVSKQPARYGFEHVEYLAPFEWETVTVTTAVDLKTLARACGDEQLEDLLKSLNPALRRYVTPPGARWDVRVPTGKAATCTEGLASIPDELRITYRYHRITKGDTAASIAKKMMTTEEALLTFNNIDAKRLHLFDEIVVPIPASKEAEVPIIKPQERFARGSSYAPEGGNVIVHRVAPGDSLWKIASRYRVSLKKLRLWNGLWSGAKLQVGQAIRIHTSGKKS
jgi:membrane-bound lytic murein transglycosylase D